MPAGRNSDNTFGPALLQKRQHSIRPGGCHAPAGRRVRQSRCGRLTPPSAELHLFALRSDSKPLPEADIVNQIPPRVILTALGVVAATALGVSMVGCGNGRPPGIAEQPGDSFVELSDLNVELSNGAELKMKVHYKFPDDLPHPDTWFLFYFDVNDGKSGATMVRKQGRELVEEGDIDASASAAFIKRREIRVGCRVQQAKSKNGPWHDVSERAVTDNN